MILVGSYASVLSTTVIGVALPEIARSLVGPGDALDVDWVITAFLVGVVLVQPAAASLAARIGGHRLYVLSLVVFSLGAALSALAPTMVVLLLGRLAQGAGSGVIMPLGMAMVYDSFPPERRGTALGAWGVGTIGAPAAGPSIGAWLVAAMGWRSIFAAFCAVGVVASLLSWHRLPRGTNEPAEALDGRGWATIATVTVVATVTARQAMTWGLDSPATLLGAGISVVGLVVFVRHSLRTDTPIVDLRMFRSTVFTATMGIVALVSVVHIARNSYVPVELAVVRGFDVRHIGLILAPAALGTGVALTAGGWVADRLGVRAPTAVGLTLTAASTWGLAHLSAEASTAWIIGLLTAHGVGTGLVFIATTLVGMDSVGPDLTAHASTMTSLNRQFTAALSVALLGALIVSDLGAISPDPVDVATAQGAYNRIFLVGFGMCALALPLVAALGTRRPHTPVPEALAAETAERN